MAWTLVAAADEAHRCCLVQDGKRCQQDTAVRITDGSWVGYVYVCMAHAELVLTAEPGCTVEPVGSSVTPEITDSNPVVLALVGEIRSTLLQVCHELDKILTVPEASTARAAVERVLSYTAQCAVKLRRA